MVAAVLFDLDETLLDRTASVKAFLADQYARFAAVLDSIPLDVYRDRFMALDARGSDFIHVSSGGLDPRQRIPVGPGYQVSLASAIKAQVATPVIAVGLITEPRQAETILAEGHADAIGIARGILYDPRWPWHAAAELGAQVHPAPQYLRCQPHGLRDLFV